MHQILLASKALLQENRFKAMEMELIEPYIHQLIIYLLLAAIQNSCNASQV